MMGFACKDNHQRKYSVRCINNFNNCNLLLISRLYKAWMWMFISLNNHFCSSNYAHCKAHFIKVVNILICDSSFFNCTLYKLKSLLYFIWIFTKSSSMIIFLWKMCFENIMMLYKISNSVNFNCKRRLWCVTIAQ